MKILQPLFLICLVLISEYTQGQTTFTEVECGHYDVNISQGSVPALTLDSDNPIVGKVVLFEYTATAENLTISTSPLDVGLDIDAQLHVFQTNNLGLIPLYYDDNSNSSHLGHAMIEASLDLGVSYIIAVSSKDGNEGTATLSIDGDCYPIVSYAMPSQYIECGESITADFTPTSSLIPAQHVQPCGSHIFAYEESTSFNFDGNGEEMTISFNYNEPGSFWSGHVILKERYSEDCFTEVSWSNLDSETNSFMVNTEHLTSYVMFLHVYQDVPDGNEINITVDLNSASPCSFEGTYASPVPLYDGFQQSGTNNGFNQEAAVPCAGFFQEASVFSFEGDGQDHEISLNGGATETYNCGLLSPETCTYQRPFEGHLFSVNNAIETCIASVGGEDGPNLVSFTAEIGTTYFLVINLHSHPLSQYNNPVGSYDLTFAAPFQFANDLIQDRAQAMACGDSNESALLFDDNSLTTIETSCGPVTVHLTEGMYSFVGDGDTFTIQTVRRNESTDFLENYLTLLSDQNGELVCETYQEVGDEDGFTQFTISSVANRTYYLLIESVMAGALESYDVEVYSPFCATCFGSFNEEGFPLAADHPLVHSTVEEHPICCLLGWTSECDDYMKEVVVFDELSNMAESYSCGIHSVGFSEDFELFAGIEVNNGSDDFELKANMSVISFEGTGDLMNITAIGLSTPTLFYLDVNGDWLFDTNTDFGTSVFSLPSELGKQYFLAAVPDHVSNGDSETSYDLTITDSSNCGICDVIFNNEFEVPLADETFQAVVNVNPSCCSDWDAGCQSLYDLFYFPNCSTAETLECGQTATGSTTGEPVYLGHTCDGSNFTSGSIWYTFEGDGKTYRASLTDSGSGGFDSKLFLFSGSCPFLNCQGSDATGGIDGMGQLIFPTNLGTTYFLAVSGEGASEGDFAIDIASLDYCGECFTAFDGQHGYQESNNTIYQEVIAEMPGCCSSFWNADCQDYYDYLLCSISHEPNNDEYNATDVGNFDFFHVQKNVQSIISDASDVDYFLVSVNQPGQMFINLFLSSPLPDLNLALYKDGILLASSENESSLESISQTLAFEDSGVYIVQVYSALGADFSDNSCYDLYLDWVPDEAPLCTLEVSVDDISGCDPENNSHEIDLEINSSNVGGATWIVNGQEYNITSESQMLTVEDIPSNGMSQNLAISVKENPTCQAYYESAYVSPSSCFDAGCMMDGNGDGTINSADLLLFLGVFGSTCQ